ncbi:MAG: Rieske 2Fe-2S domain-containing protein [Dehalococcoidia bacterium]
MLSQEENDLITKTGPGSPAGELMRRYWQPVALADEIPLGGGPLPVRLLSEDLVLFRDDRGRAGLLDIRCSHRGADLSFGRIEEEGIRCLYHGWLYDVHGTCLDQPGEPAGSTFYKKIRHTAYPCEERAGVVFAYLGPGEPPRFPDYPFLTESGDHVAVGKLLHSCNYHQANEGNFDLSHLTFLHYTRQNRGVGGGRQGPNAGIDEEERISGRGAAPGVEEADAESTSYSVRSYKRRRDVDAGTYHLYITEFVLPNFTVIPGGSRGQGGYGVNWHVPIDDTHHWKYSFDFLAGESVAPRGRSGVADEQYRPLQNRENRYLQDRQEMERETYLGMGRAFLIHDLFATESEGPIQDRTKEHLGAMDKPVTAVRKLLLNAIARLEGGEEPPNVLRENGSEHPRFSSYRGVLPDTVDWLEVGPWLQQVRLTREGDWTSALSLETGSADEPPHSKGR